MARSPGWPPRCAAGELPAVDSPDREVVIVPARGSADCAHRVVQLMTDSIPRALGIEPDQIQVVTPVHRGPAGTIELNAALKAKLNPAPFAQVRPAGSTRATGWWPPPTTWRRRRPVSPTARWAR